MGGHLRWAKPSEKSTETSWKEWGENMHGAEYHPYQEDREHRLLPTSDVLPTVTACKHCAVLIKTHLSDLAVGVGNKPWLEAEGKLVGSNGQAQPAAVSADVNKQYDETLQRCAENWMEGVEILGETHRYLDEARKPYTPEKVGWVAHEWAQLVRRAGGFVRSGIQIQELRMRILQGGREIIEEYSYLYPEIADRVMDIFTQWANPWVRDVKMPVSEADTLPHQQSMTGLILQTMWGDVDEGFLFIRHQDSIQMGELISPSPTGEVAKRNPDRTISDKMGIISDLRRVNLALKKEEVFPATTPTIQKIATRVIQLGRLFPVTDILRCKRDIANAFKLIPVNPNLMRCLCRVFKAQSSGTSTDIVGGFLSLPFGWAASPAFFGRVTEAIREIHQSCGHAEESWNTGPPYRSFLYVDDCMLAEPRIGSRPEDSATEWENICRWILTKKSINEEKALLEGKWSTQQTILGFNVNTTLGTISIPDGRILVARKMILSDVFIPGNARISLRDVQVLRGLCQHWLVANWFWKIPLQTIDVLLTHADESSSYVTCDDGDIWTGFWTLLEVFASNLKMRRDGKACSAVDSIG